MQFTSRVDHCNGVGRMDFSTDFIRPELLILFKSSTASLNELHWLPIGKRIQFKRVPRATLHRWSTAPESSDVLSSGELVLWSASLRSGGDLDYCSEIPLRRSNTTLLSLGPKQCGTPKSDNRQSRVENICSRSSEPSVEKWLYLYTTIILLYYIILWRKMHAK